MSRLLTLMLVLAVNVGFAQDSLTLTPERFVEIVLTSHPVAQQANLLDKKSDAQKLKAKGGFEPKLEANYRSKSFDEKDYYQNLYAGLEVPTYYGLKGKAVFEDNNGAYLNPESTTNGPLYAVGLGLSLGEGLFIDQRRADLKKAEVYRALNEQEQQLMLNNLLRDAQMQYWRWVIDYQTLNVWEEAFSLAEKRLRITVKKAEYGDAPTIDTVEVAMQLENRKVKLTQALVDYQMSTLMLGTFLWNEEGAPMRVSKGITPPKDWERRLPQPPTPEFHNQSLTMALDSHPIIALSQAKIELLEIEQRWAKEQLKPTVDLGYNLLTSSELKNTSWITPENAKWSVSISSPLFVRKERAELQLKSLQIQDAGWDLDAKRFKLETEFNKLQTKLETMTSQYESTTRWVANSSRLLEAEQFKFENGESSMFMINSREKSVYEASLKKLETFYKLQEAAINYKWLVNY